MNTCHGCDNAFEFTLGTIQGTLQGNFVSLEGHNSLLKFGNLRPCLANEVVQGSRQGIFVHFEGCNSLIEFIELGPCLAYEVVDNSQQGFFKAELRAVFDKAFLGFQDAKNKPYVGERLKKDTHLINELGGVIDEIDNGFEALLRLQTES